MSSPKHSHRVEAPREQEFIPAVPTEDAHLAATTQLRGPFGNRVALERALFWGLLVLSILPTLLFEHFPSEDGPLHVANAAIYLHSDSPVMGEYYDLDLFPVPNLLADLGLAGLLSFMDPALATRVLVVLLMLALPLAVRWCMSLLAPGTEWLAMVSIPLSVGRFIYYGYFNFVLGAVLSVVVLGYWLKYVRGRSVLSWHTAGLVVLFFLVYLSHPIPLAALLLLIGAVVLDDAAAWRRTERGAIRHIGREFLPVALASFAPLVLLGLFASGQGGSYYVHHPLERAAFFAAYPIPALSSYEIPFAGLLALTIVLLAVVGLTVRSRWKRPGFLIAVLVLVTVYMVVPYALGDGADIPARIALYAMLAALLWISQRPSPKWAQWAAVGASILVVAGLVAIRMPTHAILNQDMNEYLSGAEAIASGSTVLPLFLTEVEQGRGPGGGGRIVRPLIELAGFLTAEGEVVDLHHLPSALDLALFRFAPGYNIRDTARGELFPFIFGPNMVDIERYEVQGHGQVDYVWLWGRSVADPQLLESEHALDLLDQIDEEYELVFVSVPRGLLEVYERRS